MSREDIRKLLGGYATGTLTASERRELLEAALDDQELFDELAKEQPLRDVLQDKAARQQVIAALGPERKPWVRRPVFLAAAGVFATLLMGGLFWFRGAPQHRIMMADAVPPRPQATLPQAELRSSPKEILSLKKIAPPPSAEPRSDGSGLAALAPVAPPPDAGNALSARKDFLPLPSAAPAPPASDSAPPPAPQTPAMPVPTLQQAKNMARQELDARAKSEGKLSKVAPAFDLVQPPLTYSLLIANADGTFAPASPDMVLHAGNAVRLQVEAPQTGTLYLYRRMPGGNLSLVADTPVEKARQYAIPAGGAIQSDQPGTIELRLLLMPRESSVVHFGARDASHESLTAASGSENAISRPVTLEFH